MIIKHQVFNITYTVYCDHQAYGQITVYYDRDHIY